MVFLHSAVYSGQCTGEQEPLTSWLPAPQTQIYSVSERALQVPFLQSTPIQAEIIVKNLINIWFQLVVPLGSP